MRGGSPTAGASSNSQSLPDDEEFETHNLEHVSHFVRAWETEAAVHVSLDSVVLDVAYAKPLCELLAHFRERQILANDSNRLPHVLLTVLEDTVCDLADVFGRDARHLG